MAFQQNAGGLLLSGEKSVAMETKFSLFRATFYSRSDVQGAIHFDMVGVSSCLCLGLIMFSLKSDQLFRVIARL